MAPLVVPLVLLSLLVSVVLSVNNTYVSTPGIAIRSPLPDTKLIEENSYLVLDLATGTFYLNISTYFSGPGYSGNLPTATAIGQVTFQEPGVMMFSYINQNSSYCQQARSTPSLCGDPSYLQQITDGLFAFGTFPSAGNVQTLTLEAYSSNPNPNPNGPLNWLGAYQAVTYSCVGTCASLNAQVPPAPIPSNDSFAVRRFLQVG